MSDVSACGIHGPDCTDPTTHHFLKYHDPMSEFFLGEDCVNCPFGRIDKEFPRVSMPEEPNPLGLQALNAEKSPYAGTLERLMESPHADPCGVMNVVNINNSDVDLVCQRARNHKGDHRCKPWPNAVVEFCWPQQSVGAKY